jgi:hypothetical protein
VGRSFAPLDRLSTWEEVCSAISVSSQAVIAVEGESDDLRKIDSDISDIALKLSEDRMLQFKGVIPRSAHPAEDISAKGRIFGKDATMLDPMIGTSTCSLCNATYESDTKLCIP